MNTFIPDPSVMYNADGIITGANDAALKLLGYKFIQFEGKGLSLFVPEEQAAKQIFHMRNFSSNGERTLGFKTKQPINLKDGCSISVNVILAKDERNGNKRFLTIMRQYLSKNVVLT
jgi:PAS domain S-box-containing protein